MPWSFIISLATFSVTAYILKNSSDENDISYLIGVIAVVSFVVTLVVAPLPLQCLLLALALFSNKRQFLSSETRIEFVPQPEETSKLVYRGANYKLPPPHVEISEGEIAGKYRGQVCRIHNPVKTFDSQPASPTKYRGASVGKQQALTVVVQKTAVEGVEANPPQDQEIALTLN